MNELLAALDKSDTGDHDLADPEDPQPQIRPSDDSRHRSERDVLGLIEG